jgi:hypothetical protein
MKTTTKKIKTLSQSMTENEPSKYFAVYEDGVKYEIDLFEFGEKLTEMSHEGRILVSRPIVYALVYSLK